MIGPVKEEDREQALPSGLRGNQPCQCLGRGRPASGAGRYAVSTVEVARLGFSIPAAPGKQMKSFILKCLECRG